MKVFLTIIAALFVLHCAHAQDGGVTPQKTCKDFLSAETCTALEKLVVSLKEKASTIQDAVNAAIAAHKTKRDEMIGFVKGYIAENLQCEQVLTQDLCKVIFAVGNKLKLTTQQVRQAIETAVANGAATAKDIYNKAISILTLDISCDKIFGPTACGNMRQAIDKFHEQRGLLKEAIMSVALKNYNNAKDMITGVKEFIISKVVNFKCENVLPAATCNRISDLASKLKLVPAQVKEAIEMAIVNGAKTATEIFNGAIEFLTNKINCDNILTPTACKNLVDATKKLHEQVHLIQEAIMAAYLQKITDAKDVYQKVRDTLIEKAKNFKCTDVLPEDRCAFLEKLAKKFKLRTQDLTKVLIEAYINGTSTAIQIYDKTIGALIEEAKSVECEDLIDPRLCQILDAFAANLHVNVHNVRLAVKEAIALGLTKTSDIIKFVKNIIVDEASCQAFLKSRLVCWSLQKLGDFYGITFGRITQKLRELYANGITSISTIISKVKEFIRGDKKRSIEEFSDFSSQKEELVDLVMQIVNGIVKFSSKLQEKIKAEVRQLIQHGKFRFFQIRQFAMNLLKKYIPMQSDEARMQYDEQMAMM